jgi:hypothetical protein
MKKTNTNNSVVILDTSSIQDPADYCGMIYKLKKVDIVDGQNYQIDQINDLLMDYQSYYRCRKMLRKFGVTVVNP